MRMPKIGRHRLVNLVIVLGLVMVVAAQAGSADAIGALENQTNLPDYILLFNHEKPDYGLFEVKEPQNLSEEEVLDILALDFLIELPTSAANATLGVNEPQEIGIPPPPQTDEILEALKGLLDETLPGGCDASLKGWNQVKSEHYFHGLNRWKYFEGETQEDGGWRGKLAMCKST